MIKKAITLAQVLLVFLIIGICGGFEGNTIGIVGLATGIPACVLGIYILHNLEEAVSARHRKPARRTVRVAARYRDAA